MKRRSIFLLMLGLGLMSLSMLGGCNSRLLGNNDDEEHHDAVTAPAPEGNPEPTADYVVYRDNAGVMNTDPDAGFFTDYGMHYDLKIQPDAIEGREYIHCHLEHYPGHVKFTIDKNGIGRSVDLSKQTAITFAMRLDRNYQPEDHLFLYFQDANGAEAKIEFPNVPGLNLRSQEWQRITLPVSSLAGLDLTKMVTVFGVHSTAAIELPTSHPHGDFDDIVWKA